MGEMNGPYPAANFQPESNQEVPNNRGTTIRLPRAVAIFALALLVIGFPLLVFWLAANSSEISRFHFFGGLLSFFAVTLTIFTVIAVRKRRAVGHWACATATVVESVAVWGATNSGGRSAWTWLPRFTYQYVAGGQVYRGSRIAFYRRCTGSCAQELVARHPAGSQVQVYYDPARPAEAVMDRSLRALWLLPFFAVVCGALAIVFFKLPSLLAT
jgi:hypothetical protein